MGLSRSRFGHNLIALHVAEHYRGFSRWPYCANPRPPNLSSNTKCNFVPGSYALNDIGARMNFLERYEAVSLDPNPWKVSFRHLTTASCVESISHANPHTTYPNPLRRHRTGSHKSTDFVGPAALAGPRNLE